MARVSRSRREWLTVHDIASLLQVSEETVRRWIRNARLEAKFFGGRTGYRIRRADLQVFLHSQVPAKGIGREPMTMRRN